MKKYFLIFFILIFTENLYADNKIIYIDINKIISNSESGKYLNKELNKKLNNKTQGGVMKSYVNKLILMSWCLSIVSFAIASGPSASATLPKVKRVRWEAITEEEVNRRIITINK